MHSIALILHILGVILWIGGGLAGAMVAMTAASRGKEIREAALGGVPHVVERDRDPIARQAKGLVAWHQGSKLACEGREQVAPLGSQYIRL